MSGDVVARAKAVLLAVTDGPWRASKQRESRPGPRMPQPYVYPGNIVSDTTGQIVFTQTGNTANSEFIAAARSLVPELVAEVEKLRGALEARETDMWALIDRWREDCLPDDPPSEVADLILKWEDEKR